MTLANFAAPWRHPHTQTIVRIISDNVDYPISIIRTADLKVFICGIPSPKTDEMSACQFIPPLKTERIRSSSFKLIQNKAMSQERVLAHSNFSLTAARQIVKDHFKPNPWIYWADFLGSYGLGIFCFQKVRGGTMLTPHQGITGELSQVFFFFATCLLFYRCALFIHEVVHHRNGSLPVFRFVWNLLCGVTFLMPSFVYYTHIDHHRRSHYGTDHDGEYLALVKRGPWYIVYYLSWCLVIPVLAVARFLILTPIAWTVPGARAFIHKHASSMVMDPTYIRPLPTRATMRVIYWQEAACFAWCLGIAIVPPVFLGRWPIPFLVHAYAMAVVIVLLNSIRTLGSHRWTNSGGEMTFVDQLVDSVNFPNSPLTSELWAPVGCRYHGLHHLFPSMPYHQMGKAHQRLMAELPEDSPYRLTVGRSLPAVLMTLWRRSRHGDEPTTRGKMLRIPGRSQRRRPTSVKNT